MAAEMLWDLAALKRLSVVEHSPAGTQAALISAQTLLFELDDTWFSVGW